MQARLNANQIAPDAYKALLGLQAYVNASGIEKPLLELVKVRASQINGCAFCIAMHTADAMKDGESHERLHLLNAWRETALYTARERAALTWTEALTLIAEDHVPDATYDEVHEHFSDKELVDLSFAVAAINAWNRLAIAFRTPPQLVKTSQAA
ncbi:MAG TPA: carboxymuconolactone decarboxylase family protein [Candidatus Competibacter sp.]|nr:alkylhydroperoxidase [Candidatus Competibacteraceae bacterium]HRC73955.1 carboxymuconolactone decarboxylase family protein [Candidatus Competibacter sp.]